MEFLKKHYEKILLGVVLLGLAVAVAFIPFKVASERESLRNKREGLIPRSVKPLTNLDSSLPEAALKRVTSPVVLSAPLKGSMTAVPAPATTSSPKSMSDCLRMVSGRRMLAMPLAFCDAGTGAATAVADSISGSRACARSPLSTGASEDCLHARPAL